MPFNIEPTAGPGLVFITLPNVFNQMVGGQIFSILFFILLTVAALTSSISLLEVVVAYLVEELKLKRHIATIAATAVISVFGIACSLSIGIWKEFTIGGLTIFELFDFITANIVLPLGGLVVVVFAGWIWTKEKYKNELSNNGKISIAYFPLLSILIKVVAPIMILIVFLNQIGILPLIFNWIKSLFT